MPVYRITRLGAVDSKKINYIAEEMRETIESMGADFIEITEGADDCIMIVARYANTSKMEAATATAQGIFGQIIAQEAADDSSIQQWVGEVTMSF